MEEVDCRVGTGTAGCSRSSVPVRDTACPSSMMLAYRTVETVLRGVKPPYHPCVQRFRLESAHSGVRRRGSWPSSPAMWFQSRAPCTRIESSIDSHRDRAAKSRNPTDRPYRVLALQPPPWRTDEPALPCDRNTALRAHPCTPSANPLLTSVSQLRWIPQASISLSEVQTPRTFIREKRTVPPVAFWLGPPPMRDRQIRLL